MVEVLKRTGAADHLLELGAYISANGETSVRIQELRDVAHFQLIARHNKVERLSRSLTKFLGRKSALAPLEGAVRNNLFICATGPREYWVMAEGQVAADSMKSIREAVGDNASIFDQTSSLRSFRFSGENAINVLAKGSSLDLRPNAFPAYSVSRSVIAHIPALIARRIEPICHDVSIPGSYAVSFAIWLMQVLPR